MGSRTDAIDARFPPLPIGRLGAATLQLILSGRQVHCRTGPWVLLEEDGSRVVRVHDGTEPPLLVGSGQLPDLFGGAVPEVVVDRREPRAAPEPSRARALAGAPRAHGGGRGHRLRPWARQG